MAKGQLLGVATCTFALLGGTLLSGAAATAAPAAGDSSISTTTFGTALPVAAEAAARQALPTKAQVAAAKKDPESLKAMVSTIEGMIEDSNADLATAEASALNDQDTYETTAEVLADRNKAAATARDEAAKATTYYDAMKEQVGQLAGDLYRNGGINPGVTSMLEQADTNDVLYKASTMNALAANRSSTLTTAQQAASLWAEWQNYAAEAESAAAEAAGVSEEALTAAEQTRTAYEHRMGEQKKLRDELIGQLAFLHDTEKAAEEKRVAAQEAKVREAQLKEAMAAQASTPAVEEATETPQAAAAPRAPEAVPDAVPVANSLAPASTAPKAKAAAKPASLAQAAPTKAAETATEPKPVAASTPAPVRTQKPKPVQTTKPAATEPEPAAKPAATEPAPAAKPKPAPKPAAPKPTPKPTPKPEPEPAPAPAPAPSGSSKEAAIAWALRTAADDSNYYVYGGNGPKAWDCSSFAQAAFAQSGISLPRTSSAQYGAGGTKVPLSELKRGDLVFSTSNGGASFYHVAIYLGNGQVVHARNPSVGISTTPLSWVNNIYAYGVRY